MADASPHTPLPRDTHPDAASTMDVDDYAGEVALLRASLADLAGQLEAEKQRVSALEAQRRADEEKVTTLRSMVEESRRALMRLQLEASRRPSDASLAASRRGSVEQEYTFPPRRQSLLSAERSVPRRRSSLGLVAISGSPVESPSSPKEAEASTLAGLGFALDSPASAPAALGPGPGSTVSRRGSTATPLARYAHRRGSASIAVMPQDDDDAQRMSRLRELRLGVHSTKIASRRSSSVSGLPDFVQPGEFEIALERRLARRVSTASRRGSCVGANGGRAHSEGDSPLSANLNLLGRKDSLAVFESWSRRSSLVSSAGPESDHSSGGPLTDLRLQLEGLKIQLAEAEEGRRASEACLAALRTYLSSSESRRDNGDTLPLSLPPLPTDRSADSLGDATPSAMPCPPAPRQSSRWSIPRLSFSLPSRESGTPCDTSRRQSDASTTSATTLLDTRATPSMPSFGAFSFSALVSRSAATTLSADTSPRMQCSRSSDTSADTSFPVEPSLLMRSTSSSSVSREGGSGHSYSASMDDGASTAESVAPSLVSDRDSSSACSASSSRSSSPVPSMPHLALRTRDSTEGTECTQRLTVDFAAEEASPHPFALSEGFGLGLSSDAEEGDAVVEAARMPMVKESLVALSSALRQERA
ncbi:Proteophosphoglycan ppg1 [Rhodotorula diobovata]|uniref:Proteophosphoglycan ppg1 n=1 Tax=Rhodotorula diobovata TaxID=5288 RepID=A0A5C5G5I3_9BASI|nr:Proteophosphoglycan ppg1 [Rhodotorula diobovata]